MTDDARVENGVVHVDGRYASTWPECREALGLNPAGPDPVEGVEVVEVEEEDRFTQSVTLRFESPEALERASDRLFEQASEMFSYGIHDDAGDVQDFAAYALPHASEVFPDAA